MASQSLTDYNVSVDRYIDFLEIGLPDLSGLSLKEFFFTERENLSCYG